MAGHCGPVPPAHIPPLVTGCHDPPVQVAWGSHDGSGFEPHSHVRPSAAQGDPDDGCAGGHDAGEDPASISPHISVQMPENSQVLLVPAGWTATHVPVSVQPGHCVSGHVHIVPGVHGSSTDGSEDGQPPPPPLLAPLLVPLLVPPLVAPPPLENPLLLAVPPPLVVPPPPLAVLPAPPVPPLLLAVLPPLVPPLVPPFPPTPVVAPLHATTPSVTRHPRAATSLVFIPRTQATLVPCAFCPANQAFPARDLCQPGPA